MSTPLIQQLVQSGVRIPHPASVFVEAGVGADRIAAGAVLHPGSRILGGDTSIGPGSEIGAESPATVENCQLGRNVSLKGGYFSGSTFLDGAQVGSAAHVRPGTLLEEEASAAHAAGLKQTVLLPFVTLGSLINFCDCLMAGGTSRRNHSEVGSSYIHFNFTPHQDKATASLIGDVPRGVFLDQPPIFLGGQGGLVGPCRIAYGCTIPAGAIYRHDALEPGLLLHAAPTVSSGPVLYNPAVYGAIDRIVTNNLIYLGNIVALAEWYRVIRSRFMSGDAFGRACHAGALQRLEEIRVERVKRLGELATNCVRSLKVAKPGSSKNAKALAQQESFARQWPEMEKRLASVDVSGVGAKDRDRLGAALAGAGDPYVAAVQSLDAGARAAGAAWLQAIVDSVAAAWQPET